MNVFRQWKEPPFWKDYEEHDRYEAAARYVLGRTEGKGDPLSTVLAIHAKANETTRDPGQEG